MSATSTKSTRLSPRAKRLIKGSSPTKVPFNPLSPRLPSLNLDAKRSPSFEDAISQTDATSGSQLTSDLHPPAYVEIEPPLDEYRDSRKRTSKKGYFLIRLAQLYQYYGSPAHNIEESTRRAAEGLGMQLNIKSLPSFMIATFTSQDTNETVFQTTYNGNNLKKLELVDIVARRCAAGQYAGSNLSEGIAELDRIMVSPDPWSLPVLLVMHSISHGLSAPVLFNGGWRDGVTSAVLGTFTGLCQLRLENMISPKLKQLNGFFSCVFNSFAVRMLQIYVDPSICFYPTVVSSILCILPGLGITLGAIEISQSQIVAGTARMVNSFFTTILLAIGISMGSQIAFHIHDSPSADLMQCHPMTLNRWHSAAVFPVLSFSSTFLVNSSSGHWFSQIVTGTAGWLMYTTCVSMNFTREMTITLASLVIALVGHLFTIYNRKPSLIPILSGLLLLVPGGLSVRGAALSLVGGEEGGETGSIAISVITVAISISIGVFVANVLVYPGRPGSKMEPLGI